MQFYSLPESLSPSQKRRRRSLVRGRLALVMGLLGVTFILLTFGYVTWEQRNRLIQRNEDDLGNAAFFLADHAARLIEVTDLTLKQTTALTHKQGWEQVETSRALWEQIRAVQEALPYIEDVWLNDASGRLRLTSAQFPTPVANVSGRDAFEAQAMRDRGLFIGQPIVGRLTKEPTFMISRRLQNGNAEFDGTASVTVALSYFYDYWSKLRLPKGSRIALMRASDGAVIAQYPPPPDALSFAPIDKAAFDKALESSVHAGLYSFVSLGADRIGAYRQVGAMPLFIHASMPQDAYRSQWLVQTRLYGAFALIALLALLALTTLASRQFREQATTATLLERQVAMRTRELRTETAALEILNRTGSILAAELDLDRIIESVVDAGIELTGAQFGAFFCGASQDGKEHYGQYPSEDLRRAFAALDIRAVCAPAFAEGKNVILDDLSQIMTDGGAALAGDGQPGHSAIRSLIAVPVPLRTGDVHGILVFGHEKPGMFGERSERLLAGLTAQAAIALENSRLYRNAQSEIEERKQAQTQQSLLIRELHHRVKNTLATVQAVVGATARSALSIDDFYQAFVGRIISLANTHSLLTEAVWQTASLREILEKELRPYNDTRGERITLEGGAVELPSEAAVPLGMAIHELTTNAAKYGALSVPRGKVAVSWESEPLEDGLRLTLVWQERGGPEVAPPARQGFGSRLLHRVLATQLNAKVEMDFDPSGLRVAIDANLKRMPYPETGF
ncbi:two-component sensor histidine kinase/Tfp pilus assembly protein PilN [Microvirga flocculans]|uniref:histidine kinase n=1 Tax=Microvirga flocculans TaxID=217168 RepID=A0A7W6IGE9_9HYPH|nr:HWE histidine kinase domain-containing protein [Microvirga flocculans]MBB4041046.1 two-component sensor histidine kinase/Tfp pilus assembly protein PilN [Microvirga flocculans]